MDPLLPHSFFHLDEVVLLGTQDGARTGNSNPSDEVSCWEIVVFHAVESDERPCPPQASLTVYSQGSLLAFGYVYDFVDDF